MIEYRTSLGGLEPSAFKGFFAGWENPLSPEKHYELLSNSSFVVLALDRKSNKVVGFVNALSDRVHFAFIPMLEVLPEYQHKGIGSELMKRMLAQLDPFDCIDLTCDPQMQSFYERFGMLKSSGMVIRKYLDRD